MKRYLGVFLALVLLLTGLAAVASASEVMVEEEDGFYVVDESTGKVVEFTGWHEVQWDGSWKPWVYSESKGKLISGWKQIDGKWYYFWPDWPYMCTGSAYDTEKNTAFLMDESGAWTGLSATKEGWIKQGKDWYYVYGEEGSWLDFVIEGVMEIKDSYYGFDKEGKMETGWFQPYKDYEWEENYWRRSWYYAKADGTLVTGWQKIDGDWYYFDKSGRMRDQGMTWVDDKGYALDYRSGKMLSGQWFLDTWLDDEGELIVSDSWYYLGADGMAKTGWFKVGTDWYYANKWGEMQTGPLQDGEVTYYLKDSGAMAANEWIQNGGDWFYYKASGAMAENEWIQDGSAWYYLGEEGAMYHSGTYTINGKEYKFADNGVWIP